MTTLRLIYLAVEGFVFLLWAYLMFRALFGILGRHRAATGKQWIGPVEVFSVYGSYLRDPAAWPERRRLLIVTAILLALIFLSPVLMF